MRSGRREQKSEGDGIKGLVGKNKFHSKPLHFVPTVAQSYLGTLILSGFAKHNMILLMPKFDPKDPYFSSKPYAQDVPRDMFELIADSAWVGIWGGFSKKYSVGLTSDPMQLAVF